MQSLKQNTAIILRENGLETKLQQVTKGTKIKIGKRNFYELQ